MFITLIHLVASVVSSEACRLGQGRFGRDPTRRSHWLLLGRAETLHPIYKSDLTRLISRTCSPHPTSPSRPQRFRAESRDLYRVIMRGSFRF